MYFLGIDNGGTVTKAALYDKNGRELGFQSRKAEILIPQPGFVERDLHELKRNMAQCVQSVIHYSGISPGEIAAVSTSCHGKGLYLLKKNGEPAYNGIISSDSRARDLVRDLKAQGLNDILYSLSFQQMWTGHPVVLLKWFSEHNPSVLDDVAHVLMGHDYIRYILTGEVGAEITNMSGSGLIDVSQRRYSEKILEHFQLQGMENALPPLVNSIEQCGRVSRAASEETGIPEGTPVYGGFFDVVSSAISSGLVNGKDINATAGTWCIATGLSNTIIKSGYPYIWGNYCIDDVYFVHEGSPTSASNLDWFVERFVGREPEVFPRCDRMVKGTEFSKGLLFFPYVYSSNMNESMNGGLWGLQSHHSLADILRAVYEGIIFSHKIHLERLYGILEAPERITLVGGPSHSDVWMQMFADVFAQRIEVPDCNEAGCKGAALAAMVGSGVYGDFGQAVERTVSFKKFFEPDAVCGEKYEKKYESYIRLGEAIGGCL